MSTIPLCPSLRSPEERTAHTTRPSHHSWLIETGLALDRDGFIRLAPTLESVSHPGVFAAGDIASLSDPRPKAGVFAVRAGPPLTANIRRALAGDRDFEEYWPQRTFLGIIGTGMPELAVASRGELAVEGAWVWALKDWIDRKWMAGYTTDLPDMGTAMVGAVPAAVAAAGPEALDALAHASMRCGGCGAKVGATVLSAVIRRLQSRLVTRPEILVGLDAPDDCAVVKAPGGSSALVHTVDFFRSFVDDPFIFGKIAANHALSDCHAMCAEAQTALAIAVVPFATEEKVGEMLFQMMAGACETLKESGCALVGGHTCEGTELALGFCVNGSVALGDAVRKGGMRPGDALLLTKPIGTGTIFAGEMRMRAHGASVAAAVESMCTSNRRAAFIVRDRGATSCTDVTGFGVLGHLAEMVRASAGVAVELDLDSVPTLPGAQELVAQGIFSSLQPANLRLKRAVANESESIGHPTYPLLFDPQTAGGLLATIPADEAGACVAALRAAGYPGAAVIGRIMPSEADAADGSAAGTVRCIV